MAMQAPKQKHHPSAPANRRGTPQEIVNRERGALDFYGNPFVRRDCQGRAAKNKGGGKGSSGQKK